ncbi:MAG: SRPBCC family protein [Deltaproteobacteria bacterium]|nr:SRPBCC family protein [Deltaproteobacteria bacterium]
MGGHARLEVGGGGKPRPVGAVRGFAGGMREKVLEFEPPKRMTYTVVGGFFPVRDHLGEVTFAEDGEGTRVVWRCRFEPKIPGTGALMQRFITFFFTRGLRGLEKRGFSR